MRLKLVLVFIAIIIVLGRCQMPNKNPSTQTEGEQEELKPADMDDEDLPDVRAFKDEFTRGFLQSTEETRPGYYPFSSATGAYKMDFPAEGKIGEKSYNIKNKSYEGVSIGVGNEQSDITHTIKVKYYNHLSDELKESRLGQMESNIGMDLEFEEKTSENQTLYLAPYQHAEEEYNKDIYGFAALILNEKNWEEYKSYILLIVQIIAGNSKKWI